MIDWIFVWVCALMVPGIMLLFGWWFGGHPPKKINHLCGYRTRMAMKNMDTWVFAHKKCCEVWLRWSKWAATPGILFMLCASRMTAERVELIGCVVLLVQVIILIASLVPVEKALRETFDENGNRK